MTEKVVKQPASLAILKILQILFFEYIHKHVCINQILNNILFLPFLYFIMYLLSINLIN